MSLVDLKRQENENEQQYIWRLCMAKDCGELDMSWEELSEVFNKEFRRNDTSSAYRKPFQNAKLFRENVFRDESNVDELREIIRRLKIERSKLQTEKRETNQWLREYGRDEMIAEQIGEAIKSLKPLDFPTYAIDEKIDSRSAVLCFGDAHYGVEFDISGLYGEPLNRYNPEVFEWRMQALLSKVKNIIAKENITTLHVYEMGDFVDGILRVSQLRKLKYGVIDGTIKYANYITEWLNELSKSCHVVFNMVGGNHTELRMLGQPKGTFEEENMEKVLREFIKVRLDGNKNIEIADNPTGYIFETLNGYHVMGFHGDIKNVKDAINTFSNLYGVNIDYLVLGHYHHNATEQVGVDKEVIMVPSIMGTDGYAMKLGKASNAGAILFFIDENDGKSIQYNINLNNII